MIRKLIMVITVLLAGAVASQDVLAGNHRRDPRPPAAETVPLSQIVRSIQQREGGKPESIEFRDGRYRILWRGADGQLRRYEADAATGRIRSR